MRTSKVQPVARRSPCTSEYIPMEGRGCLLPLLQHVSKPQHTSCQATRRHRREGAAHNEVKLRSERLLIKRNVLRCMKCHAGVSPTAQAKEFMLCRWGLVPSYTKTGEKPDYFRMVGSTCQQRRFVGSAVSGYSEDLCSSTLVARLWARKGYSKSF